MKKEILQTAFNIARVNLDRCDGCRYQKQDIDHEPYGEWMVERETYSCGAWKPSQCQAVDFYIYQAIEEHENDEE
jgi:hypothetical protein